MRYEQQWQSLTISLTIWLHEFPTVYIDQCKTSTNILGLCPKSGSNRKTQSQMWKKQNWKEKPRKGGSTTVKRANKKKKRNHKLLFILDCSSVWSTNCKLVGLYEPKFVNKEMSNKTIHLAQTWTFSIWIFAPHWKEKRKGERTACKCPCLCCTLLQSSMSLMHMLLLQLHLLRQ
jgi:hypothetical protein